MVKDESALLIDQLSSSSHASFTSCQFICLYIKNIGSIMKVWRLTKLFLFLFREVCTRGNRESSISCYPRTDRQSSLSDAA